MKLFFIDESGTGMKDKGAPCFVLAATVCDAADLPSINDALRALKRRLISWAQPEDFELHGHELRHGLGVFAKLDWPGRLSVMREVAAEMARLPLELLAVVVRKAALPPQIATEADLYRVALTRMLDEVDTLCSQKQDMGLLMMDSRSDLHSSVQDRRVVDAFWLWASTRPRPPKIVDAPWFGFSHFYAGIQLADFASYLIACDARDAGPSVHPDPVRLLLGSLQSKIRCAPLP
ncbi:MAG: DUF3800 domain-containing protein [Planctomycetes bacterium]|nr:DUF3800 domain-containing protein [Planctomycetota bacterium]